MKIFATILTILSFTDLLGQTGQDYCVRVNDLNISKVKKIDAFKDLSFIQLVSFQGENYGNDLDEIPKDSIGNIALSKMKEAIKLSRRLEERIIDQIFNYDYDPKFEGVVEIERAACYIPRNAILFVDKRGDIIGYIEICFECQREVEKVPGHLISGFCYQKFELLKDIFAESGIKYGVTE
jgi:hypothetical protein